MKKREELEMFPWERGSPKYTYGLVLHSNGSLIWDLLGGKTWWILPAKPSVHCTSIRPLLLLEFLLPKTALPCLV